MKLPNHENLITGAYPPAKDIEKFLPLLASSKPVIERHAVTICDPSGFLCSGVFVKSLGFNGILTAGHCAKEFTTRTMALIISAERHRVLILPEAVEEVPIGDQSEAESDISFVIILDRRLIRTINESGHEFYDLDFNRDRVEEVLGQMPDRFNWAIEGNPGESIDMSLEVVDGEEQRTITTTSTLIQGILASWIVREQFDYLKIVIGSGFEDYPACYKGVSGGGIWYQRLIISDGVYKVEPFLAGMVCWQGEPFGNERVRVRQLTGHGWLTVYGQVPKGLVGRYLRKHPRRNQGGAA